MIFFTFLCKGYNMVKNPTILFFLFLYLHQFALAEIKHESDKIILENNLLKKVLVFSKEEPDKIIVHSIFSKQSNKELLNQSDKIPYFEFVINKKLVTSKNKIWQYKKFTTRKMGNGGEEIKLILEGKANPVNGLQVTIYQQLFPNTSLMREKLELSVIGKRKFYLNKLNNQLHFKFPQYSLKTEADNPEISMTEIRLATWANELIAIDKNATYDERFQERKQNDHNLANCHMFHSQLNEYNFQENEKLIVKGPINFIRLSDWSWMTAYEHASQDNLRGVIRGNIEKGNNFIRDGLQGTRGNFNFEISEEDFKFLGISQTLDTKQLTVSVDVLRGGYLDGEIIDKDHPYSSVWTASGFFPGKSLEKGKEMLQDYLWRCICEKPASRKPEFYYNTWGMQRKLNSIGQPLRGVLTEAKIKKEIQYAAELGVDIFVLDDGWEQAQGVWQPHKDRLPNGLKPVKDELDKHGIKLGVWFSPMGIDSTAKRYKQHPEWIIRDSDGNPIKAQWNKPAFDFVSDFYSVFVNDCKKLIDQGVRFFKWDAINTFFCSLPGLHHGDSTHTPQEIRERYAYLLPIYVTKAMKELTDYEPKLVIEIDLTEARRCMIGLAVLSNGKYFWMNNGASGYNDYSAYRTKSMRTIPNLFAGLIPLELFTYANYPHKNKKKQRYNVNTSLIAGHGFWGALEFMKPADRIRVGKLVAKSKRVLPYITEMPPEVIGKVGASPEIYTIVNNQKAAGQVIAFSGQALNYKHKISINKNNLLGVLNHAYELESDSLNFDFDFPMPDATREAFILPNKGVDIGIRASTSWLDNIELREEKKLYYVCGAPGEQKILWSKKYGKPRIKSSNKINYEIKEKIKNNYFEITITVLNANTKIYLESSM
jgi:hypothetical protein